MAGTKKFNRKDGLEMFTIVDGVSMKLCSKCKQYKPHEAFSKCHNNSSGLKSSCKFCASVLSSDPNHFVNKHYNELGLLKCTKCGEYKPEESFSTGGTNAVRHNRLTLCKICESDRKRLLRISENPKEDLNLHLRNLLRGCNNRVQGKTKKGSYLHKKMDIDLEYLIELFNSQNGLCAISGIKMTYFSGYGKQPFNVSIDRLDCSGGYTKGNIQLVCSHINIMRGNLDVKELIRICNIISEHNDNRN